MVSRSGREIVKGGIQLSDSVSVRILIELLFVSHFSFRFFGKEGRMRRVQLVLVDVFSL